MWIVSLTVSVSVILMVTRLAKAGYYDEHGKIQNKDDTATFKCTEEGYHPDPHDCRVYYRCVDWGNNGPLTTFRFECGVGTVFSKDKGDICAHPEDSGRPECSGSDNELDSNLHDPSESPTTAQITVTATARPRPIATQASMTMRPVVITTEATATTIGGPEATIQSSSTTDPSTVGQSENNASCQNEPECTQEGFLADNCNCRKFYRCVNEGHGHFRRYSFTCGAGTVWDPDIQGCNHAWAVERKDCRQDLGSEGNDGDDGGWNNGQWNDDAGGSSQSGLPEQAGSSNGELGRPDNPNPSYPGTSGTASGSNDSGYPGRPCPPGTQGTPGSPGYPEPSVSSTSSYPGTSGSSGVPTSPESPSTTGFTESSSYPGSPESSDSPAVPEIQGLPDSPNNQPFTGICTANGFFADPKDCRKFYRCVGDNMSFTKYEFQCGTGTAWDSSIQSCNHDYAVPNCDRPNEGGSDASQSGIDSTDAPDTSKLTTQQTSIHATDATNSPVTSDQSTSVSYLPPATSVYPPTVAQSTESVSYLPPATQTTASISYLPPSSTASATPESASHLPDSTGPTTEVFTTSTSSSSSSPSASLPQDGKCTEEGFFPNPDDCRKFYRCVATPSGYHKYEFQCGPGTAWDQSLQTCNHIAQVPCSTESNQIDQGPDTSKPASPPPSASGSTDIVSNQTETTPSSTSSVPTENVTGTPTEASTESSMEVNKTETSMTTSADITTVSSGERPASEKPEAIQMPESSSTESSSESMSEQSTSESSEETSSSSTESHASDCATKRPSDKIICDNAGFYPHPTRCDKFYRCVDNGNGFNVYHFDCPPGTIFDPSISVCNYPESVYPARDCATGDTAVTSSDRPTTESTTRPEAQSTDTSQTTSQQTEEVTEVMTTTKEVTDVEVTATTSSTEMITSEGSTAAPSTESATSETPEGIESTTESGTESTISITDAAIEVSSTLSTESTESETPTAESQSTTESEESTTESREQSATTSEEQSTTESQEQSTAPITMRPTSTEPCSVGNLTDEQIILVCPTGFRRHPKHCNLFYQCTSEGNMEIKILVLSCPEDMIFDENKIQCLPENSSSQACTGTKASARFYRRLEDNSLASVKVSSNRLCPEEGHFPYEEDCSNIFYKCKRNVRNNLQGYLYKCPEDFIYWSVSRRCERVTRLPMCSHSSYRNKMNWQDRWRIPTEDFNLSARMLRLLS